MKLLQLLHQKKNSHVHGAVQLQYLMPTVAVNTAVVHSTTDNYSI
jgi:hypothetical protein